MVRRGGSGCRKLFNPPGTALTVSRELVSAGGAELSGVRDENAGMIGGGDRSGLGEESRRHKGRASQSEQVECFSKGASQLELSRVDKGIENCVDGKPKL